MDKDTALLLDDLRKRSRTLLDLNKKNYEKISNEIKRSYLRNLLVLLPKGNNCRKRYIFELISDIYSFYLQNIREKEFSIEKSQRNMELEE